MQCCCMVVVVVVAAAVVVAKGTKGSRVEKGGSDAAVVVSSVDDGEMHFGKGTHAHTHAQRGARRSVTGPPLLRFRLGFSLLRFC